MDGRRYKNIADIDAYIRMMDMQGHAEAKVVDARVLMTKMIMMQLRLVEGLSIASFRERTGVNPVALFGDTPDRLINLGLVTVSDTHIAVTRQGRLISDAVVAELAATCGDRVVEQGQLFFWQPLVESPAALRTPRCDPPAKTSEAQNGLPRTPPPVPFADTLRPAPQQSECFISVHVASYTLRELALPLPLG